MLLLTKAQPIRNKSSENFEVLNKKFYEEDLDYDWTDIADHVYGPETFFHRWRSWTIEKLIKNKSRGQRFLDAGCGTGLILRHLPQGSVGLDINKKALEKAKQHAPKAKLILGDIEKMPFKDKSFNVVLCTEVLEHLLRPELALKEINRVLTNGGYFIGSVPRESFLWKFQRFSKTGPKIPYHKHHSEMGVKELLKDFRILKLEKGCGGLLFIFVVQKISNGKI